MSIFLKLTAVGVLTGLILAPSVMLSSNTSTENVAAPLITASTLPEKDAIILDQNEETEQAVIKVASLTIGTDHPGEESISYAKLPTTDTDVRLTQAKDMATHQQFDEALKILNGVRPSERNDYAVKHVEALILSWAGKHSAAEKEFFVLRNQYPDNPELLVSYGYLQLYQNKNSYAEDIFAQVLKKNPDYQDARNGLNLVRKLNIK